VKQRLTKKEKFGNSVFSAVSPEDIRVYYSFQAFAFTGSDCDFESME
jgi:hypothetical protein